MLFSEVTLGPEKGCVVNEPLVPGEQRERGAKCVRARCPCYVTRRRQMHWVIAQVQDSGKVHLRMNSTVIILSWYFVTKINFLLFVARLLPIYSFFSKKYFKWASDTSTHTEAFFSEYIYNDT